MLGCSSPRLDVSDCEISCSNDQGCLNGMSCKGNFCVDPSRTEACPANAGARSTTTTISGGMGGTTSAGEKATTGGQPQGGNAGTTTGGGGGTGNTATEGGVGAVGNSAGTHPGGTTTIGGGGTDAQSTIGGGGTTPGGTAGTGATACSIKGSVPAETCTERPYHADLEAICPTDSYVWVLRANNVDNLRFENANTARPDIVGTPRDACIGCQLSVDVYSTGVSATQDFPLQVYSTPHITTTALPDACVDQLYDWALSAEGGDSAQYEWDPNISEETGLSIQKGHLTGLIKASGATPRDVGIDLTVRDSHCSSDTVHLTLRILGAENTACPKIQIEGTSPTWPAPPACKGRPYSLKVTAKDGAPNYSWGSTSAPVGFVFDQLKQELTATSATEAGDFVVQVGDQMGRLIQKTYRIEARDKCWLGYIYKDSKAQLRLIDPYLNVRKVLPTQLGATESVVDFEFSPDGRFIACHVADSDAAKPKRLVLIQTADLNEQQPDFGGSVTHFAWSSDSTTLAVAFGPDGSVNLGGLQFTNAGQGIGTLTPVAAPVDSPIVWFGADQYVAFHPAFMPPNPMRAVHVSQLGDSGFGAPSSPNLTYYLPPLNLRGAPTGYYAQAPSSSLLNFYPIGAATFAQHGNVAIPPDGAFVGLAADASLQLYKPESDSRGTKLTPWLPATGCGTLLTWARQADRIACLGSDGETVNVFAFSDLTSTIASFPITGDYNYGSDRWKGQQRMLSPKGKWLTFTTAYDLYVASLDVDPAIVTRAYPRVSAAATQGETSAAIEYSPNEEWVAVEAHGDIAMCRTSQPTIGCTKWLVHPKISDSCDEALLSGSTWCGSASNYHGIVWSPDSKLVGVERDDGSLQIMDMRMLQQLVIEDACANDCVGKYQFQP